MVGRRLRGQAPATAVIGGVSFNLPARRYRNHPAFYRERILRLRDRDSSVRWPYPRLAACPDPAALRPPMVLVTFHMGPLAALGGLVERLPGPVCVLLGAGQVVTRKARYVRTLGDEQQRAAAVVEALHTLRSGGYALVVVDEVGSAPVHQEVLGRPVPLATGAFALARLADAPMLPVAVRWRGPGVEIVAGEAIAPDDETTMAATLAAWLEGYLRAHPRELSFNLSRRLGVLPAT